MMKKLFCISLCLLALLGDLTAQRSPYKAQKDDWILASLYDGDEKLVGRWVRPVLPDGNIWISRQKIQLHAEGMAEGEIADALVREMTDKGLAAPIGLAKIQVSVYPKGSDKIFVRETILEDRMPILTRRA